MCVRPSGAEEGGTLSKNRFHVLLVSAAAAALFATSGRSVLTGASQQADDDGRRMRNAVLAHEMDIEAGRAVRLKHEQPISAGVIYAAREAAREMEGHDAIDLGADPLASSDAPSAAESLALHNTM
jgi:hypothetical protein